jgi:arsenate reductase
MQAFREAFRVLENRIKIFVSLPLRSLDTIKLKQELDRVGQLLPE